ncbi:MAG: PKD domain-containing protein [Bacteroidia bacterium]|nr:PKD domain-containing protein [Bacteroidia bacterium]
MLLNRILPLVLLFILQLGFAQGQNFPVGHRTITYNDPSRTGGTGSGGGPGRQIQTELYYPGASAGNNVAVAFGSFPVVVFGHGFQMSYDVYSPIYDSLAARGYIVCMATTEGGLLPTHTEFAKDLAIILDKTLAFNTDVNSPFYGRVNGKGAIGGHSMGGGCSFLSAQYTNNETAIFNFAAAETNPSAIAQCSTTVSAPLLVIAGSYDVVAPPADNQDPMYAAALSACKTYFNITGGYHCQFSNISTQCQFGEGTLFPPSGGPSRNTQLQLTRAVLIPFLDFWLKGVCAQWTNLMTIYNSSSAYTVQQTCNVDFPSTATITPSGPLVLCPGNSANLSVNAGNYQAAWSNGQTNSTISVNSAGNYSVTLTGSNNCSATSAPVSVSISQPNATITPSGPTTFCEGDSIILSAPANASYAWNNGSTTQAITVAQSGNYSVLVTNANNCQANSQNISVTVLDSLSPSISNPENFTICGSSPIRLFLPDSSTYSSIAWSTIQTGGSISVSNPGTYCAQVNNNQGCGGSVCVQVVQESLPSSSFLVSADTIIQVGQTVNFSVEFPDPNTSYTWDFGDGTIGINSLEQHSYSAVGSYVYCLTATSANGNCNSTTCDTLAVDQTIGIPVSDLRSLTLFPNPLEQGEELSVKTTRAAEMRILDSSGRENLSFSLNPGENRIELSYLSRGLYLISFLDQHYKLLIR